MVIQKQITKQIQKIKQKIGARKIILTAGFYLLLSAAIFGITCIGSDINGVEENNYVATTNIKARSPKGESLKEWSQSGLEEETTYDDLVNISDLSDEFMQDYLEGVRELQNNEENILIVTSPNEISETFGATNIVAAPNNQYFLQYNSAEDKERALQEFYEDDSIFAVDENMMYEIEVSDTDESSDTFFINNYSVESTTYNSWGIEAMGIDHAFSQINNLNHTTLNNVNVAVIDTGLDVGLFKKYYKNKLFETYNVVDDTFEESDMYDNNGHGTHVAGTIAEGTPDNVKIIPIKVSDGKSLSTTNILTAINYVVYYKKASVINMSFGSYGNIVALETAINAANSENIICVAAAGNDNSPEAHYPSALNTTISVASVASDLSKSSFSNYHQTVDFTAPGTAIKSIMGKDAALSQGNGNNDDDDHEIINGTSMATPHIVSAVAILKSFNKDLTIDEARLLLRKNAIDLGVDGRDKYFGYGFVTFAQTTFCDSGSCDEYNVYDNNGDELSVSSIEMVNQDINHIHTKYGNITDLLGLEINIYFNNGMHVTKKLGDLDGLVIDDYDTTFEKDQYGNVIGPKTQDVTIQYKGKATTATVMTYPAVGSSWEYEMIDDNNVRIIGFAGYVANNHPSTIYIPETIDDYTVLEISDNAFKNNQRLKKVFLPLTIKVIGSEAFYNNTNLTSISPLEHVEVIGENAFKNTGLETAELGESLTSIGAGAFENTMIANVYIPKTVNFIGAGAFAGCNNIETIVVDNENEVYDSRNDNNVIVETASNTLIKGNYNTILTDDIEIIGEKAFYNDSKITNINIPTSVTSIESLAFAFDSNLVESKLSEIAILRNVTSIATDAFNEGNKNILIYTYSDAAAKEYAVSRKLPYETMNYSDVIAYLNESRFNAFDKVSGAFNLGISYNAGYYDEHDNKYYYNKSKSVKLFSGDIADLDTDKYQITYIDGRDSLRYGDGYVTITGKDGYGADFTSQISVVVYKATPIYEVPSNITARVGQSLSSVALPDNFEWMNSATILTEEGEQTFKAKYVPTDTQNYKTVENIDILVTVRSAKTTIAPDIQVSDKTYDGTTNIDLENIIISNLDNNDYSVQSATLANPNAGNTTATIALRLSDEKFDDYTFENESQEKEFTVDAKIVPQKLVKPTKISKTYTYNGKEQTIELSDFNDSKMNITGNTRTNAGEQNVTISLKNSNYIWNDNTTTNIVLNFVINKAHLDVADNTKNASYVYDNKPHTITLSLNNNNFVVKYMDNNKQYTLNECPKYTNVGVYTIKYKVYLNDNYDEYYGERTLTISSAPDEPAYTISNYSVDETNKYISKITVGTTVGKFKSNISLGRNYEVEIETKKVNDKQVLYTGGKTKIIHQSNIYAEYTNVVIGDVNGDGAINSADLLKIRQHLLGVNVLSGAYFLSSDINYDNNINSADLLRVRQHLLGTKTIE